MAKFIQLSSMTPGAGKLRVNPDLLAMYFKRGANTAIILAASGNPVASPGGAVVPGLIEIVTETPEEIDKLIDAANRPFGLGG